MITPELKEVFKLHTTGMNPLERRRSAQVLIKRYGIVDPTDLDTIAEITMVNRGQLQPASVQKKLY